MMQQISFYVTTRDRPLHLVRCLSSLDKAISTINPGHHHKCIVVDDSTSTTISSVLHEGIARGAFQSLEVEIVGRDLQAIILDKLKRLDTSHFQEIHSKCRHLSTGPWDHAGAGNFAYLHAYCFSPEESLTIFFDDDILLSDSIYHGHQFKVNGAEAIQELVKQTQLDHLNVTGVPYLGRTDVSIIKHLKYLLADAEEETLPKLGSYVDLVMFPQSIPIYLNKGSTDDGHQEGQGPGKISGAAMATTVVSLRSHGLMSCYNEDWIWISLVRFRGGEANSTKTPLLHAPPVQVNIAEDFVAYQERGEIAYNALMNCMSMIPAGERSVTKLRDSIEVEQVARAISNQLKLHESCLEKLSVMEYIMRSLPHPRALSSQARHSRPSEQVLKVRNFVRGIQDSVQEMTAHDIVDELRSYLDSIPIWEKALPAARDLLSERCAL